MGLQFCGRMPWTWMVDGPFVFIDRKNNNRAWISYSWVWFAEPGAGATHNPDNGNHIYVHPMSDPISKMDPEGTGFHLAYCRNSGNSPGIVGGYQLMNGESATTTTTEVRYSRCHQNLAYDGAVAESQSIYYNKYDRTYYVLYSRNVFNSNDYQILYRTGQGDTFGSASLGISFRDENVPEKVLVRSSSVDGGYGNGEIFEAWGKVYLLCTSWVGTGGNRKRVPFFKELTFQSDSQEPVLQLVDVDLVNRARGMNQFLVPDPRPTDFNQDGICNSDDFFAFLTVYLGPCP